MPKYGGIMKLNKRTCTAFLIIQIMLVSFLGLTQEVEAKDASSTYSHAEISIEINSTDALRVIKTTAIEDFAKNNEDLSLDMINIDESEMFIDQLDITKVSAQRITLLIKLKPSTERVNLIHKTISTTYKILVVDTIAPELTLRYDTVQIRVNSEFDPMTAIKSVTDNSGIDYYDDILITNPVDSSTLGSYEVIYRVYDQDKNETSKTLFVQVAAYSNVQGGFSEGEGIDAMLTLINEARAQHGLEPLELADEAGQRAIAIRAQEAIGDISHRRPDGSHYKTALSDQGVVWERSPLEILTYAGNSVESSLNWWLNSSGHRAILLKPDYKIIAIGRAGSMWAAILY